MPIYRIADLNVEINPKYKLAGQRLEPYIIQSDKSDKVDITVSVTDGEITQRCMLGNNIDLSLIHI